MLLFKAPPRLKAFYKDVSKGLEFLAVLNMVLFWFPYPSLNVIQVSLVKVGRENQFEHSGNLRNSEKVSGSHWKFMFLFIKLKNVILSIFKAWCSINPFDHFVGLALKRLIHLGSVHHLIEISQLVCMKTNLLFSG